MTFYLVNNLNLQVNEEGNNTITATAKNITFR